MPPLQNLFRQRIIINPRSTSPNKSGIYVPSGNKRTVNGRFQEKQSWVIVGGEDISRLTNIMTVHFPPSTKLLVGDYITLPNGDTRVVGAIKMRYDGLGNEMYLEATL